MNRALHIETTPRPRRPPLSAAEYHDWRGLIQEKIGVRLSPGRPDHLQRRLWERMGRLSIFDYGGYYRRIASGWGGAAEWQRLVELIVNRQSGFFRHPPSFDALMERVLPELARRRRDERDPVRLWSAGCSRGQEAWSMAMACDHVSRSGPAFSRRITGTDISLGALAGAERGEYSASEVRDLPDGFRRRYMRPAAGRGGPEAGSLSLMPRYRVAAGLKDAVRFRMFNLIRRRHDGNPPALHAMGISDQDVVFCQNVLIYFSLEDRAGSVKTLLRALKPQGRLFLGPGETAGLKIIGAEAESYKEAAYFRRTEEDVDVRIVC